MGEVAQIRDVVEIVECEIYDVVKHYKTVHRTKKWISNYVAKVTLELTVTHDGSVAPDFALLGPFAAGTYALGLGGSLKGAAERIGTYAFTIHFNDYKKFKQSCEQRTRLSGSVGFRDWFGRVIDSHDRNDPFDHPTDLTHKLDFTIDAGLKVTPAYEFLRSKASSPLSANWNFKHSVEFVMTYDAGGPDYEKVCVVNAPGPCYEPGVVSKGGPKTSRSVASRLDALSTTLQIRTLNNLRLNVR
jgi:hypothetical protein